MPIIDPHRAFPNGIPKPEDLNIFTELKIFRKRYFDTSGVIDGNTDNEDLFTSVNFLGYNQQTKTFTTDYTNNTENFGITNIDITITSSYVPQVTITFKDIRGRSLFNVGANSPYAAILEFPPPIFELTIKGFYGKKAKYFLHLLKQNTKFDSSTGDWIITAQFVGLTFAPLSDIYLTYLKAAPYIDGRKSDSLDLGNTNTSLDLLTLSNTVVNRLNKVNSDDKTKYDELDRRLKMLDDLFQDGNIKLMLDLMFDDSFKKGWTTNNQQLDIYNILTESVNIISFADPQGNEYKNSVDTILNTYFDFCKENFPGLSYNKIDILKSPNPTVPNNVYIRINGVKEIGDEYIRYRNKVVTEINELSNTILENTRDTIRDIFGFDLTIRNVFNVLLNDAESFINQLRNVSLDVLNDESRKTQTQSVDGNDPLIFPFPTWSKVQSGFDPNANPSNWKKTVKALPPDNLAEVQFVDRFISAALKSNLAYDKNVVDVFKIEDVKNWFPINASDTVLNTPYNLYSRTNSTNYLYSMIANRAKVFSEITVPNNPDDNYINICAEAEAWNIIYGLKNTNPTLIQQLKQNCSGVDIPFDFDKILDQNKQVYQNTYNNPPVITYPPDMTELDLIPNVRLNNNKVDVINLNKEAKKVFFAFLNELSINGYSVIITSGFRSNDQQRRLNATNNLSATAGFSKHEIGMALDINVSKNGITYNSTSSVAQWKNSGVIDIANKYNLQWGGGFTKEYDPVHFAYTEPLTTQNGIVDLRVIDTSYLIYDSEPSSFNNFGIPVRVEASSFSDGNGELGDKIATVMNYYISSTIGILRGINSLLGVLNEMSYEPTQYAVSMDNILGDNHNLFIPPSVLYMNYDKSYDFDQFLFNISLNTPLEAVADRLKTYSIILELSKLDICLIYRYNLYTEKDLPLIQPIYNSCLDYYNNNIRDKVIPANNLETVFGFLHQKHYLFVVNPKAFSENTNDAEDIRYKFVKRIFNIIKKDGFKTLDKTITSERNIQIKTLNDIDIRTEIYYNLKSFHDRWILGGNTILKGPETGDKIIDRFLFVDRGFNDIGDKLILDLTPIVDMELSGETSLYTLILQLLTKNNMEFFVLPNYSTFTTDGVGKWANTLEDIQKIFGTSQYEDVTSNPAFICMHIGGTSSILDTHFNDNVPNRDDGAYFLNDDNSDNIISPTDLTNTNVNAFKVKFGYGEESIFKSVNLDQAEFKETLESIRILDTIAKKQDEAVIKPQNLFNVYEQRSYTCHVEMMGNALIQPTMYFSIDLPLFKGVYLILTVNHNIDENNNFITTFSGVRIPDKAKPFTEKYIVYSGISMSERNTTVDAYDTKNVNTPSDTPNYIDVEKIKDSVKNNGVNSDSVGIITTPGINNKTKALLDVMSYCEGVISSGQNGYNVLYKFKAITGWTPEYGHGHQNWRDKTVNSSPAGRYQIVYSTWIGWSKQMSKDLSYDQNHNTTNLCFSKTNQDLVAANIIESTLKVKNISIDKITSNNIGLYLDALKNQWVSINSYSGKYNILGDVFTKALNKYQNS